MNDNTNPIFTRSESYIFLFISMKSSASCRNFQSLSLVPSNIFGGLSLISFGPLVGTGVSVGIDVQGTFPVPKICVNRFRTGGEICSGLGSTSLDTSANNEADNDSGSGSGFSCDHSVLLGGSSALSYRDSSEVVFSGSLSVSCRAEKKNPLLVEGRVRRSMVDCLGADQRFW